jgi:hypothetical protein
MHLGIFLTLLYFFFANICMQVKLGMEINRTTLYESIRLLHNSKCLFGDSNTVEDLGLYREATLHLMGQLRGGGFPGLGRLWQGEPRINIEEAIRNGGNLLFKFKFLSLDYIAVTFLNQYAISIKMMIIIIDIPTIDNKLVVRGRNVAVDAHWMIHTYLRNYGNQREFYSE